MGPVREQDTEGEHGAEQCQLPQPLRAVTALTALALQVTRGIAHSGAAPVAPKVPKSGTAPHCLFPLGGEHRMGSSWLYLHDLHDVWPRKSLTLM